MMSVSPLKASADAPTFSYAQAAKGLPGYSEKHTKGSVSPKDSKPKMPSTEGHADIPSTNGASTHGAGEAAGNSVKAMTSSPSIASTSTNTLPKEDDMSLTPNGSSESTWDKQSVASAGKSVQAESAKEKAEEPKEKPPARELKEAPLPVVNVWQKRKEESEAKAKATVASKPATPSADTSVTKNTAVHDPSKGTMRKKDEGQVKDKKKVDVSKKAGLRNRNTDEETEIPPPVGDPAAWPTPQIAQGEEMKKVQERNSEKQKEEKPAGEKRSGREKWKPVPYVPTAIFETPLPPAARRGGRTGRGGRDGGRGGHHALSDRSNDSATGARVSRSRDRSRFDSRDNAYSKRSNSTNKTAVSEQRKQSHFAAERQRGDGSFGNGQQGGPVSDQSGLTDYNGRPEPRPFNKGHNFNGHPKNFEYQNGSHDSSQRFSDRRFENGMKSGELIVRERGDREHGRDREFRRERPDRNDSRPERGRGGYRGRGNHSNYTGPHSHSYQGNSTMNHPFSTSKPFNRSHGSHNQRANFRSPTLPNTAVFSSAPFTPLQTDMSMYGGYAMSPAPISAPLPYSAYVDPFYVINALIMQLEYYFSVDNLCKDMFLRKHMDSQGFVFLSVISNFKRVKHWTEDFEFLRNVCRQLRSVEYRMGGDGVDRLRRREKWEPWVLSMEARDPSARNDGPPPSVATSSNGAEAPNEMSHLQSSLDNVILANGFKPGNLESVPCFNGVSKTLLSSTAPEFSPNSANHNGIENQPPAK